MYLIWQCDEYGNASTKRETCYYIPFLKIELYHMIILTPDWLTISQWKGVKLAAVP